MCLQGVKRDFCKLILKKPAEAQIAKPSGGEEFAASNILGYGYEMLAECARVVPVLTGQNVGVARRTSGLYLMTPDHMPIIGFDANRPGLLHATAMCGHGIMMSAGVGQCVAELIKHGAIRSLPEPERVAPNRSFCGGWDSTTI